MNTIKTKELISKAIATRWFHLGRAVTPLTAAARKGLRALPSWLLGHSKAGVTHRAHYPAHSTGFHSFQPLEKISHAISMVWKKVTGRAVATRWLHLGRAVTPLTAAARKGLRALPSWLLGQSTAGVTHRAHHPAHSAGYTASHSKFHRLLPILLTFVLSTMAMSVFAQTELLKVDFETAGDGYTPSKTTGSGYTDIFNRTAYATGGKSGSDYYWAAEDISGNPTITLDTISISGYTSFDFYIDLLERNNNDWDSTDEVKIMYQVDSGSWQNLIWIQAHNDDSYNEPACIDRGFDGNGDIAEELPAITDGHGTNPGNTFATFSETGVSVSGNNLTIRIEFYNLTSNDEGIYMDNITIDGVGGSSGPEITVGTVTAFGNQTVNTASSPKSYSVSGSDLTANITVSAPTGFEVSLSSGSGYGSSVTVTQSGGSANDTVYVRFKPTAITSYSGNISHTSTDATTKNVAVSGTGIAPANPASFSVLDSGTTSINVTYSANANGNNVVVVFDTDNTFSTPSGAPPALGNAFAGGTLLVNGTSGSPYNHTGRTPGETYYYKAWSYDSTGNFYSSGLTDSDDTDCFGAPTVQAESSVGSEQFNANWSSVSGATKYYLDVATNSAFSAGGAAGDLIFSQYTETDSGTTPKGVEVWNATASDITFNGSDKQLTIWKGVNGGSPSVDFTLSSGTLNAGDVLVIGTSDMSPDEEKSFTFNGDDSLVLKLGGVTTDVIGTPGSDPGSAWSGGGVSTANRNIKLKTGITEGDTDGWTDPSARFEDVSAGSTLTDFGTAPSGGGGGSSDFVTGYEGLDVGNVTTYQVTGLDPEKNYYYRVRAYSANCGETANSGTETVTTTSGNSAPTDMALSDNNVNENAGANATVGTLSSTDPDAGDTFVYTLVSGSGDTDNGSFNISGSSLRATASLNHEAKDTYSVRVRTTDSGGLYHEEAFTINVVDVNEVPTDLSLSSTSIAEGQPVNTVVGTFSTTDPDDGDTFVYSLVSGTGDTGNGSFNINGSQLRADEEFDYESQTSYSIRVQVRDVGGTGLTRVETFTITITDVNEAYPTVDTPTKSAIDTTFATLGARVTDQGGGAINDYGIVWAYTTGPDTGDNKVQKGTSITPTTTFTLSATGMNPASHVYYRGYAANAFGTGYSAEDDFYTEPSQQPTVSFSLQDEDSMRVSWSGGNGDGTIVVMRKSFSPTTSHPADGTVYAQDAAYGSGAALASGYVVYVGSGNYVDVTGLDPNSTYYVALYEYAGSATKINYQQGIRETGSSLTTVAAAPTVQASSAVFVDTLQASTTINWQEGNGAYSIVVMREGGAVSQNPVDGTTYSDGSDSYTSGTDLGSGNYVVYVGSGTSVYVNTLSGGSNYHIAVYTFNGGTGAENYLTASPATANDWTLTAPPATAASGVSFANVGSTAMRVSWIRGDGDQALVVLREGSAPEDPVDGNTYTANAAFTGGSDLGSGSYVIYKGIGTQVDVTGLSPSTTYYVEVFEFNRTADSTENYRTTDPASGNQATVAGQEIAVSQDGVNLADGGSYDFGNVVAAGSVTVTNVFVITNSGGVNLTLGSLSISGTHAADFSVALQPTTPVAPGGSTTFKISFNPGATGARTASASFSNNDADENPFNFTLNGTGATDNDGPDINLFTFGGGKAATGGGGGGDGVLDRGDVAVIGLNADNDDFTWVALEAIPDGAYLYFNENGWYNNGFQAGEGSILWTNDTGVEIAAGTKITYDDSAGTMSVGSIAVSLDFNLAGSGDQILVYKGTPASPYFITAVNVGDWKSQDDNNESELPPDLTNAVTAVALNVADNSIYDMSVTIGSAGTVLSAIMDVNNWNGSGTSYTLPPSGSFSISTVSSPTTWITTDGVIAGGGYPSTATVQDAVSGIPNSGSGLPRYALFNDAGAVVFSNFYTVSYANGSTAEETVIDASVSTGATASIDLGSYTARFYVNDTGGSISTASVAITVTDDDTTAPVLSNLQLQGGGTSLDLTGDMVIQATVTEADNSVLIAGGYAYYLLKDSTDTILFSNNLVSGGGSLLTHTEASANLSSLGCGQDYTVTFYVADSDADRGEADRLTDSDSFVVHTIGGAGGPSDYPTASGLEVEDTVSASASISDADVNNGGWKLELVLTHDTGIYTGDGTPAFNIVNNLGTMVISSNEFGSVSTSGSDYNLTESTVPGVSKANVSIGVYTVQWSASNDSECVASVHSSSTITDGNSFTVYDDDTTAPSITAFAASGGFTVTVTQAEGGFAVTGLVQDAGSGVAFDTSFYLTVLDSDGTTVLWSNNFDTTGLNDGDAKGSAVAVANTIDLPDGTVACGEAYTVMVYAVDFDDDRNNDASSTAVEAMVFYTSGAGGAAPTASNLEIREIVGGSPVALITDNELVNGGWLLSMELDHGSGIDTNNPNQPTFTVLSTNSEHVYTTDPLQFTDYVEDGGTYYVTNSSMPGADTNKAALGTYTVYWSAQSEGLCFGEAADSSTISGGATFSVIDDDSVPPNKLAAVVAGGTVTSTAPGDCSGGSTDLVPGDIAIFNMNTLTSGDMNGDGFAFINTVDLPAGTQITFTDCGWNSPVNNFRDTEGHLKWEATDCVPAGTIVIWTRTNTPMFTVGTTAVDDTMFAPNIQGEQILAYQGPQSNPTFIYAIHARASGGIWDAAATDSHSSGIPPGLIDGYTCVAVNEKDNVILNTNNLDLSTLDRFGVLLYIGTKTNWVGSDTDFYPTSSFNFQFNGLQQSAGGQISDHDINTGGWSITGVAQDVTSGLMFSNAQYGLKYNIINTTGTAAILDQIVTNVGAVNGYQGLLNFSNSAPGGRFEHISIGTYTCVIQAADTDADRAGDILTRVEDIPFTVVDDDAVPPQVGYFLWNGKVTIDLNEDLSNVALSGRVQDVTSGIAFQSEPVAFTVYDSDGSVFSNGWFNTGLSDGDAKAWTTIETTLDLSGLGCGSISCAVVVTDNDYDRPRDRLTWTNYLYIDASDGSGSPASVDLLQAKQSDVNPANTNVTDADIALGGWDLAVVLSEANGISTTPPDNPSYEVYSASSNVLVSEEWSTYTTDSTTFAGTNIVAAADIVSLVDTGLYTFYLNSSAGSDCVPVLVYTSRFTVVDDDTEPPVWTPGIAGAPSDWTNVNSFNIKWNPAADASGYHFRTSTNIFPTSVLGGQDLGFTTNVDFNNVQQGVITQYLFAVDEDNDRPYDRLRSPVTSFVFRVDQTNPDRVNNLWGAPGAFDNQTQIDLNWAPAGPGDIGPSQRLSPWDTYQVFVTPAPGGPTSVVTRNEITALAETNTSYVTIPNLEFGEEYRIWMRGRDRAGNIGPTSEAVYVSLAAFNLTQGVWKVVSQDQIHLSWTASYDGKTTDPSDFSEYDIIFAESPEFGLFMTNKWEHMSTVRSSFYVDEGNVEIDPPGDINPDVMRFYRASPKGTWMTNRPSRLASEEVYVLKKIPLEAGQNWISLPGLPDYNTVKDVFRDELPAGTSGNDTNASKIMWYAPGSEEVCTQSVYQLSGGYWHFDLPTEKQGQTADFEELPLDHGFVVKVPVPTEFLFIGRVPFEPQPARTFGRPQPGQTNYVLISFNQPRRAHPSELGLLEAGFLGAPFPKWGAHDMIWKIDEVNQIPDEYIYYSTWHSKWMTMGNEPVPPGYFGPDESFVLVRPYTPFSKDIVWTNNLLYKIPTKNINP